MKWGLKGMMLFELLNQGKPEATALIYKDQSITYREMQGKTAAYRQYFVNQGIASGENVGLFCKNSPEFIYAYFALAQLGAVVVPLNLMLTEREMTYIAGDAQMKNLITMAPVPLPASVRQHVISEFAQALPEAADDFTMATDENRECVIIYTSGTTGFPKGAVLTHSNLANNARMSSEVVMTCAEDNFLCVLPMFHSFAWTVAVLCPLLYGGCVTIVEQFMPKDVITIIREQKVTVVSGVPAMYNFYKSLGVPEDFTSVRLFISGGASLPLEILNQFHIKTHKDIVEGYGLSEASPVVTINPLGQCKPGSIGKALPGIEVSVVDADGVDLPPGEIGELITRSVCVMKGYYNMPEATEKAIVDGWLHTGDMAYIDEEGYVYIVDRLKDLVIVGGLNVYPREVEEVIYQFEGIFEAAVIGVPDRVRGEVVCAYVVMKEDTTLDKKKLMAYLQENLSSYKLPKEIIQIESMPKNATGKIMKKMFREQQS